MITFFIILGIYFLLGIIFGILAIKKQKEMYPAQKALSILGAMFLWGWFLFDAIRKIRKNIKEERK